MDTSCQLLITKIFGTRTGVLAGAAGPDLLCLSIVYSPVFQSQMAYPDPRFRSPTILLFSQKKPLEKEGL